METGMIESPLSQSISLALQPAKLEDVWRIAKAIAGSDLAPKDYREKPDNVFVAMMMGAEIGLSPMASIQNIAVINGRPSLWGDAALAVVRVHRDFVSIVEELDDATLTATCSIARRGQGVVTRTFSRVDAEKAKLWGKDGPWTHYPRRMLQMRARGWAMRDAFPDALRGLHMAEEARDLPRDVSPPIEANVERRPTPLETRSRIQAKVDAIGKRKREAEPEVQREPGEDAPQTWTPTEEEAEAIKKREIEEALGGQA